MANRNGKIEAVTDLFFGGGGLPKSLQMVTAALRLKMLAPWMESCGKPGQHFKDITLMTKVCRPL